MSSRRWRRCTAALFLALLIGAVVWYSVTPHPRLNLATWKKITLGMDRADVEALLNVRPGDYSSGFHCTYFDFIYQRGESVGGIWDPRSLAELQDSRPRNWSVWWGRHRALAIVYDHQDKVKFTALAICSTPPKDRVARLVFWFDSWLEK